MSKIIAVKYGKVLQPTDDVGEQLLAKMRNGAFVVLDVKQPRNIQHHRLYWALVHLIHDNIDHRLFPSPDNVHDALKWAAGIRQTICFPITGEVVEQVGSTSFEKMDQTEFAAFFERACDLVAVHFVPGLTSPEVKKQISEMTGIMV
jgi:hypothetical protein